MTTSVRWSTETTSRTVTRSSISSAVNETATSLTALEIEDLVTVRDVVSVLQRTEIVMRISDEIERYLVELGSDGRLVGLQLRELMAGVEDDRRQVVLDYFQPDASWNLEQAMATLSDLETDQLLDAEVVADALHLSGGTSDLDGSLQPRGYRILSRVPRLPAELVYRMVDEFHTLDKLMRATIDDLAAVDGVGDQWATTVKDALSHIAESAILDRYN